MPYWQLFCHLVWSTRNREPLLTTRVEPVVYGFLRSKAIGLGATLFALGGTEDHVHMVVAIPPAIAVASFVGQVKGVASAMFNKSCPPIALYWQNEYGAFSFSGKNLADAVAYVEQQKLHHAQAKIVPVLERTDEGGVIVVRETSPTYQVHNLSWWDELCMYSDVLL